MEHKVRSEQFFAEIPRTSDERRRFQRFEVDASARIEILGSTNRKRALFLRITNISAEGAFLPTKRAMLLELPVKMDIFLNLNMENGNTSDRRIFILSVTGKVARVERSGMAVRFNRDYEVNPINMKLFAKN
jgi:hypothetical protein